MGRWFLSHWWPCSLWSSLFSRDCYLCSSLGVDLLYTLFILALPLPFCCLKFPRNHLRKNVKSHFVLLLTFCEAACFYLLWFLVCYLSQGRCWWWGGDGVRSLWGLYLNFRRVYVWEFDRVGASHSSIPVYGHTVLAWGSVCMKYMKGKAGYSCRG